MEGNLLAGSVTDSNLYLKAGRKKKKKKDILNLQASRQQDTYVRYLKNINFCIIGDYIDGKVDIFDPKKKIPLFCY